jgi:hypothetical protein
MHVARSAANTGRAGPWLLLGPTLLLAALAGCKSGPNVVALSASEQNLTFIALAYLEAHGKLGRGPKNAEELKPFLKEHGDPDQILTSPNDGQPYVVVWDADPTRGGPTAYRQMWAILAYERKGSGGKRAVTDIRGRPLTIPAEDFSQLSFVGGHKPSAD